MSTLLYVRQVLFYMVDSQDDVYLRLPHAFWALYFFVGALNWYQIVIPLFHFYWLHFTPLTVFEETEYPFKFYSVQYQGWYVLHEKARQDTLLVILLYHSNCCSKFSICVDWPIASCYNSLWISLSVFVQTSPGGFIFGVGVIFILCRARVHISSSVFLYWVWCKLSGISVMVSSVE